jgi:hypothetical protein
MVVDDPRQVDAAWMEAALRTSGALDDGGVEAIELEPGSGRAWSRIMRIRVRYQEGSSGEQPERLLLKLCGAEGGVFGPSEVHYYNRDYIGIIDSPIPRCFDAVYLESPRRYHLLLEDLSDTHPNFDDREPTAAYAQALAVALATLHAHRWGVKRLNDIGLKLPEREDFSRYMAHVGKGLDPLLALAEGEIETSWPSRLRRMVAGLVDRYTMRADNPHGITKIHGDLNPGNILAPIEGAAPIYLIDHQPFDWSLTCWLGASDLVNVMVLWWDTSTRRNLEMSVLWWYHAALSARGVTDYTFDQLIEDYRLCLVEAIAVAIEWCVLEEDRERMRWLWSTQLRRAMRAYDELCCDEIWE